MQTRRAFIAGSLFLPTALYAREQYPGQYAQAPNRDWFNRQQVPAGPMRGQSCCSNSDGVQAEEDIREGVYWARFDIAMFNESGEPIMQEHVTWMPVPAEAVLKGPFRPPAPVQPVVWWAGDWANIGEGKIKHRENGQPVVHIRCFKPGAGV